MTHKTKMKKLNLCFTDLLLNFNRTMVIASKYRHIIWNLTKLSPC
jgi:hypothetical protein